MKFASKKRIWNWVASIDVHWRCAVAVKTQLQSPSVISLAEISNLNVNIWFISPSFGVSHIDLDSRRSTHTVGLPLCIFIRFSFLFSSPRFSFVTRFVYLFIYYYYYYYFIFENYCPSIFWELNRSGEEWFMRGWNGRRDSSFLLLLLFFFFFSFFSFCSCSSFFFFFSFFLFLRLHRFIRHVQCSAADWLVSGRVGLGEAEEEHGQHTRCSCRSIRKPCPLHKAAGLTRKPLPLTPLRYPVPRQPMACATSTRLSLFPEYTEVSLFLHESFFLVLFSPLYSRSSHPSFHPL